MASKRHDEGSRRRGRLLSLPDDVLMNIVTMSECLKPIALTCTALHGIVHEPCVLAEWLADRRPSRALELASKYRSSATFIRLLSLLRQKGLGLRHPLQLACREGLVDAVRVLLHDARFDVDDALLTKDDTGYPPFNLACMRGHNSVAVMLLERLDTNPNQEHVKYIVNRADTAGKTALHWASQRGHTQVVCTLLDHASICPLSMTSNGRTPLHLACLSRHIDVVKLLLPNVNDICDNAGNYSMHLSCAAGHTNVVTFLLRHGGFFISDVNFRNFLGVTPFMEACSFGHVDIVRACMETGRHKRSHLIRTRTKIGGLTALHLASQAGHAKVVSLLLDIEGAIPPPDSSRSVLTNYMTGAVGYINTRDRDHATPLHLACKRGNDEVVRLLLGVRGMVPSTTMLTHSAGVDAVDCTGKTPLHWACSMGHEKVVETLLSIGNIASLVKDDRGRTALHEAIEHRRVRVLRVMLKKFFVREAIRKAFRNDDLFIRQITMNLLEALS